MKVRIISSGAAVPDRVVYNEELTEKFPGPIKKPWTAAEFEKKTGIRERRFFCELDDRGRALLPSVEPGQPGPAGTLMESALREALERSDIDPATLDGLIVGSVTPDRPHFGDDGQLLHHRLGMRPDASVLQVDIGCGGAAFCLQWAQEILLSGLRRRLAVVMVQTTSPRLAPDVYSGQVWRDGKASEAFLSALLFGDGAGALILEATDTDAPSGFESSVTRNEYCHIVEVPGGGNLKPPGRSDTDPTDFAFHVIGRRVADSYAPEMIRSISDVMSGTRLTLPEISRFYLHQPNLRLVEKLIAEAGIPADRTAINVDRYGNTSHAGVVIALAEDIRAGVVEFGSGTPILMASIGANFQNGAHVIRL